MLMSSLNSTLEAELRAQFNHSSSADSALAQEIGEYCHWQTPSLNGSDFDLCCTAVLKLASAAGADPGDFANELAGRLRQCVIDEQPGNKIFEQCQSSAAGFINLRFSHFGLSLLLAELMQEASRFNKPNDTDARPISAGKKASNMTATISHTIGRCQSLIQAAWQPRFDCYSTKELPPVMDNLSEVQLLLNCADELVSGRGCAEARTDHQGAPTNYDSRCNSNSTEQFFQADRRRMIVNAALLHHELVTCSGKGVSAHALSYAYELSRCLAKIMDDDAIIHSAAGSVAQRVALLTTGARVLEQFHRL
jgi:arginyl-tRNA synthetase